MNTIRVVGMVLLCLMLLLASTGCGKSDQSPQDGQTADTTAPSAPTNLTCTNPCNDTTRTFTWQPATDDDSGVDHYEATIDGGGVGNLWSILGDVTTYTFDAALALSDGSHTFEVRAVDKAGNEGPTATLSFICDTTQPGISSVTTSVASASSVTITWTTNEPAASQVEYGTTTAYGSSQPATPLIQSSYVVSHSIGLTGLTPNTAYHYRVRSIDACRNENMSGDYTFFIDTIAPAISDVAFSPTGESGVTITWTTDEASTSQVEYGTTTGYGSTSSQHTTVKSHSISLTGLSIATTYHFRVNSHDSAGNEAVSGDYTFTTLGTLVGGIISENTTWTKAASPYLAADTVQIPLGVKLTIEPGVTVTRPASADMYGDMFLVHGEIYAHGTVNSRIAFDGGGNSDFFSAQSSSADAFVDLEYCMIRNGISFWPATGYQQYGHFSLRRSELTNLTGGSSIWYPQHDVYIEYNKITNCGGFDVGTSGSVKVYIRYNLFNGKDPDLPNYADFCVENWAAGDTSETIVQYNSFINMSGVVLRIGVTMSATQNYWGTQDTALIDAMIYDRNDDITVPNYIVYLPILTMPHPDTPTV